MLVLFHTSFYFPEPIQYAPMDGLHKDGSKFPLAGSICALRLRSEWDLEAFPVMSRLKINGDRQRRGIGNLLLVSALATGTSNPSHPPGGLI